MHPWKWVTLRMGRRQWSWAALGVVIGLTLAVGGRAAPPAHAGGGYPIVDTRQTRCYSAQGEVTCPAPGADYYGQDAQTLGQAPSYSLSADGQTVSDAVTGLIWERSPDTTGEGAITASDKLTYTQALAHCAAHASAHYAGYDDWRLPGIKELYSLIQFNGTDPSGMAGTDTSGLTPFIDTTYFQFAYGDTGAGERVIDAQYASSTLSVANTANDGGQTMFGVNFADGRIKGYGLILQGQSKTFFVQCVRGNLNYGVNAFVDHGDQTVTDTATGLMWSKVDSGAALNWQAALAWVQTQNAANYLGHNDWRLPNAKELQSLVDYGRSPATSNSAALDPIFTATMLVNEGGQTDWPWYWTSTTHGSYLGGGASAVYLSFGRAGGWQKATPFASCYTFYDVHGAGAQRSDPKTASGRVVMGTACSGGTAYGLGPQGDVQRAANYVRLVRDDAAATVPPTTTYLPLIALGAVPVTTGNPALERSHGLLVVDRLGQGSFWGGVPVGRIGREGRPRLEWMGGQRAAPEGCTVVHTGVELGWGRKELAHVS